MLTSVLSLLRSELVIVERAWRDDAERWLLRKRGRDVVEHLEAVDRALDFELRDARRAAHDASAAAFALVHLLDAANLPADVRARARLAIGAVLDALAPYLGRADVALRRVVVDGLDIEDALRV